MSTTLEIPLSDHVSLIVEEGSSRFEIEFMAHPAFVDQMDDTDDDGGHIERFRTGIRLTPEQLVEVAAQMIEFAGRYSGHPDFEAFVKAKVDEATLP